jgi:tetratricopeptide (TPR) repeat protein
MAYLPRRFNREILVHLMENDLVAAQPSDYPALLDELRRYSFVKYREDPESLLLHDEMQVMIRCHVLDRIDPEKELRDELYEKVVHGWYEQQIEQATEERERQHLMAEQVGYSLDQNLEKGLAFYREYMAQARAQEQFGFEELLWGEIEPYRRGFEDGGYSLSDDRAEWLFGVGYFAKAAVMYEQMLADYADGAEREMHILARLGHCYLREGVPERAIDSFHAGMRVADVLADPGWQADFQNNEGQAYRPIGRWQEALDCYEKSIHYSREAGDQYRLASAYRNSGFILAQLGRYREATTRCRGALDIHKSLGDVEEQGRSYFNLGQVTRYSGDYMTAHSYYERARHIFEDLDDREGLGRVRQGLGINHNLIGRKARELVSEYVEDARQQVMALKSLSLGLDICRDFQLRRELPSGLNRLASVFEEIGYLHRIRREAEAGKPEVQDLPELVKTLQELDQLTQSIGLPEQVGWRSRAQLVEATSFEEMDHGGKAQLLFEVSYLEAEETYEFHTSLDSLTEAARLAVERGQYDQVLKYCDRMEYLRGYDYQEPLFVGLMDITLGHLAYEQGDLDRAFDIYGRAYPVVAETHGFADHLLSGKIQELVERMRALPPQAVVDRCQRLLQDWAERRMHENRPDTVEILQQIHDIALTQIARSNAGV